MESLVIINKEGEALSESDFEQISVAVGILFMGAEDALKEEPDRKEEIITHVLEMASSYLEKVHNLDSVGALHVADALLSEFLSVVVGK